jgi:hypothetical protein
MKYNRVISTAVMFLLLGSTLPAFAQKGGEEKGGGGKAPQAQPQRAQPAARQAQPQRAQATQRQAQPQRAQATQRQAQPQRAQATQRQAQPQRAQQTRTVANNRGGGGQYGRISNANYSSHFGHEHSFHMGHPQFIGGYNRFQYGGYWFGYNQGWPIGWGYDDNCYVVYEDGAYYMYDLNHPGIHISLSIF